MARHQHGVEQRWRQARVLKMGNLHGRAISFRTPFQRKRVSGHTPSTGDQNLRIVAGMRAPGQCPLTTAASRLLCRPIERQTRQHRGKTRQRADQRMRGDDKVIKGPVWPRPHQGLGKRHRLQPHTSSAVADNPDAGWCALRAGHGLRHRAPVSCRGSGQEDTARGAPYLLSPVKIHSFGVIILRNFLASASADYYHHFKRARRAADHCRPLGTE